MPTRACLALWGKDPHFQIKGQNVVKIIEFPGERGIPVAEDGYLSGSKPSQLSSRLQPLQILWRSRKIAISPKPGTILGSCFSRIADPV